MKRRCKWVGTDPLYIRYHDTEWGVPLYDDQKLFEFLILEGVQAGLSWITVLKKRKNYQKSFNNFDYKLIADYDNHKILELLLNKGIIRNRLKIEAAINNAKAFLKIQEEFGRFSMYIWRFVDGRPKKNRWRTIEDIPRQTNASKVMSIDLKKRGFKFVGPTICYSFMQSVGMVNDHTADCFRYHEV